MATIEIMVAVTVEIPDELIHHPLHGAVAIAKQYALMATHYASIGATSSSVVAVQNADTLEFLDK